ncbi:hypothetical protein BJ166DRAFT_63179 [Pestalotiopsis sp. NC0098]|nr:hypothetical protein BJ166DRAFT_63179 [Pestalotiopsis sp. NC0098]
MVFDPRADPFGSSKSACRLDSAFAESSMVKSSRKSTWRANPIDVMVLEGVRRLARLENCSGRFPNLERVIRESVLHLCDLQILSGLAILVAGYLSLSCGLASYHWQMIAYLAWFSCLTHQGGLTVLREDLVQHSVRRTVRLVLMSALFLLLLVALVPTGRFAWNATPLVQLLHSDRGDEEARWSTGGISSNALCYFPGANGEAAATSGDHETVASHLMMFSVLLLSHGFLNRTLKLFRPVSRVLTQGIRQPLSNLLQTVLSKTIPRGNYFNSAVNTSSPTSWQKVWRAVGFHVVFPQTLSLFIVLRFHLDLYVSMLGEIYWLTMTMAWGLMQLIKTRSQPDPAFLKLENQWTFGQIIPVVLLAAPILTTVGMFGANGDKSSHHSSAPTCDAHHCLRSRPEQRTFDGSHHGAILALEEKDMPPGAKVDRGKTDTDMELSHNIAFPGDFSDSFISNLMQTHFGAAEWIDIYMTINTLVIIFLTACAFGLTFGYDTLTQAVEKSQRDIDIQDIWLNRNSSANYGVVTYIVLSHTSACASSGCLGMKLAPYLRGRGRLSRRLKRVLFALLLVGVHALYIYAWLGSFDLAKRVGLERDAASGKGSFMQSMGSSMIVALITTAALHVAFTALCVALGWLSQYWCKKGETDAGVLST